VPLRDRPVDLHGALGAHEGGEHWENGTVTFSV
jgi:hypothetical protein